MPLVERFGSGVGLTVGVQIRIIGGITTFSLDDVTVRESQLYPKRVIVLSFSIDGETYQIEGTFTDETYFDQTLQGSLKGIRKGER